MPTQYDDDGKWVGCLAPRDVEALDVSKAVYLTGPAGSLTLHNCRLVHGSPRNDSDLGRPLLLYTLTLGRCIPLHGQPDQARP